ncbi:hypothetical protein JNUCC64_17990 [Streptomyces sp. JNUCC 64]
MSDPTDPTAPAPRLPVQDTHFGEITVRQDGQDRVEVGGPGIPLVTLERRPGSDAVPHIAIGTRDAALLTLRIDGHEARVKPGKGGLTRRSYRVDVRYEGTSYRLVPDSVPGSRLIRDGEHLGDFTSLGDESVIVEWKEGAGPEPLDAALGYALASAFGTGGQPMWMLIADGLGIALP